MWMVVGRETRSGDVPGHSEPRGIPAFAQAHAGLTTISGVKFRTSPDFGLVRDHYWSATVGDRILLHPELDGFESELQAEVIQAQGDILRVRALHDLDLDGSTRIVARGAEFLVGRAHVHAVRTSSGAPLEPHDSDT